jgi:hypothetical protein
MKAEPSFVEQSSKANTLITWLRGKTAIIGLVRARCRLSNLPELSIIRPVPTRWTAFCLAYKRLLRLRNVLELVMQEELLKNEADRLIVQGKRDTKQKAIDMIAVIQDPTFWFAMQRYGCTFLKPNCRILIHISLVRQLEPLAIAANITQATFCRLDQVLITFGRLYMTFALDANDYDPSERPLREAILESLERRWNCSDQLPFIASLLLNPFIDPLPFPSTSPYAIIAGQHKLIERMWK